jgi:hypothetical protein
LLLLPAFAAAAQLMLYILADLLPAEQRSKQPMPAVTRVHL